MHHIARLCPRRGTWPAWEVEFLRKVYADHYTEAIARVLGRTMGQVTRKAFQLGVSKSPELIALMAQLRMTDPDDATSLHRFTKGHVPWQKGKKMPGWQPGRMAQSQFKKGQRPSNWMPIGSYRVNNEGELQIKYADVPGPYWLRWREVRRDIWEAAHGPVPEGMVLAWKAGRKTTDLALITADALECISKAENMRRNTIHNLPEPLREVAQLRGRLTRAIREREKEQP